MNGSSQIRRDSPLAGQPLELIPRVERLLSRAERAARPRPASPSHLLLALITGNEPACEILDDLGVDLEALAGATMHSINEGGCGRQACELRRAREHACPEVSLGFSQACDNVARIAGILHCA